MEELERAVVAASDEATVDRVRRHRWVGERPLPRKRRGKETTFFLVFCLVVAAGAFLPSRWGGARAPSAVEVDLRFAVEAVAMQVEAFRVRAGRLPRPSELSPPLSDAVRYLPAGDHYVLEGRVGDVEVVLDSRSRVPPPEPPEEQEEGVPEGGSEAVAPPEAVGVR